MEQIQNINNVDLITAKELISIPPDDTTRQFVKITGGVSIPGDGYVGPGTYYRKPDGNFEPVVGGGAIGSGFQSGILVGTGAPQLIPHDLGAVPTIVLVSVYENGGAGFAIVEGVHTATNLIVTATLDTDYKVIAFVG